MKIDKVTACHLLNDGHIVAVPTETVYGLAANIFKHAAISRVFATKGRPTNHPLIVHISDTSWLTKLAKPLNNIERRLIHKFWPGPLTIVTEKTALVPATVTGGQSTVALRQPSHPLFNQILKQTNQPLAAPSANPFKSTSPTTAQHVLDLFQQKVPVVDGGPCDIGIESTIVRVNQMLQIEILRPGVISDEQLTREGFVLAKAKLESLVVSGNLKEHYQPKKKLICVAREEFKLLLKDELSPCAFITHRETPVSTKSHTLITLSADPKEYGRTLYKTWHELDKGPHQVIYLDRPPQANSWAHINDKIYKACSPSQLYC